MVQPTLGYPGLKASRLTIDRREDYLRSRDGRMLLTHIVGMPQENEGTTGEGLCIHVIWTREAKGVWMRQKENRLLTPMGILVLLRPKESRMVIPRFLQSLIPNYYISQRINMTTIIKTTHVFFEIVIVAAVAIISKLSNHNC